MVQPQIYIKKPESNIGLIEVALAQPYDKARKQKIRLDRRR